MIFIYPRAEPFFLKGSSGEALLLVHGFTASPSEVYPIAKIIHESRSCTVSGILLPGHGSSPKLLNQCRWQDWYKAVAIELNYLLNNYERVYVGGLSMGALLAMHAGIIQPGLSGVIAINAPIYYKNPVLVSCTPLFRYIRPYFPKKAGHEMVELERNGRFAYRVMPVKAFHSMLELRRLVMKDIQDLKIPMAVFQSLLDDSVAARSGRFLFQKTRAVESTLIELKESGHIASMGPEKGKIAQEIIAFMNRHSNSHII